MARPDGPQLPGQGTQMSPRSEQAKEPGGPVTFCPLTLGDRDYSPP